MTEPPLAMASTLSRPSATVTEPQAAPGSNAASAWAAALAFLFGLVCIGFGVIVSEMNFGQGLITAYLNDDKSAKQFLYGVSLGSLLVINAVLNWMRIRWAIYTLAGLAVSMMLLFYGLSIFASREGDVVGFRIVGSVFMILTITSLSAINPYWMIRTSR